MKEGIKGKGKQDGRGGKREKRRIQETQKNWIMEEEKKKEARKRKERMKEGRMEVHEKRYEIRNIGMKNGKKRSKHGIRRKMEFNGPG